MTARKPPASPRGLPSSSSRSASGGCRSASVAVTSARSVRNWSFVARTPRNAPSPVSVSVSQPGSTLARTSTSAKASQIRARGTRTTTVSSASALIRDDQSGAGRGRRGGRPLDRCEERLSYRQAVRERAHVVDVGGDTGPSGPQAGHRQRTFRVDRRRDPGTFIPETQAAQEEIRRLEPVGEDERVGGKRDIADLD